MSAQLVRAPGVIAVDGTRRVIVYLHRGAFLADGAKSDGKLVQTLSNFADSAFLVVNYRLLPKHSIGMALEDCYDIYRWLWLRGYNPGRLCLAGDSTGGYLALVCVQRLQEEGEEPAALVVISPFLQLAKECKQAHPNKYVLHA
uniref:Ach n=1 Tax=Mycobacterium leprae TaxID=1769 RepID=Q50058_MYCLR|nr:ach [Mycobacterium leprae]